MTYPYTHLFDPSTLSKAYPYANSTHIDLLRHDIGRQIKAQIKGTLTYDVEIYINESQIKSTHCSCPVTSHYCKHIAAILLYLDEIEFKRLQKHLAEE